MGAFTVFPLAAFVAAMLYALGTVNLICAVVMLVIQLVVDRNRPHKIMLPLCVFLMLNGVFIVVTTSVFLGKFILFLIEIFK